MDWKQDYQAKLMSAEDIAKKIKSGDSINVSPLSGTPPAILEAIEDRWEELDNVLLISCAMMWDMPFLSDTSHHGHLDYVTHFVMPPWERQYAPNFSIKYASVTFSKIDYYFREVCKNKILIAGTSLPDDEGYMWFGPQGSGQVGSVLPFVEDIYIQTNADMPKVGGPQGKDFKIHVSDPRIRGIVEEDYYIVPVPYTEPTDLERKIASYILPEIEDGSTVQIGIGGVANAVGYGLDVKKDLGCYTEMIGESTMHLIKKGVINKPVIGGFLLGGEELYAFGADPKNNISLQPTGQVCNAEIIKHIPKMVSINTCLIMDLTGQVCSEAIGTRPVACTGGSTDFVRGATESEGGKSFITLPATRVVKGEVQSSIVSALPPFTPVTVPRSDVMYVVTEYGMTNLYTRNIQDRVEGMISIAHPDFRESLRAEAKAAKLIP